MRSMLHLPPLFSRYSTMGLDFNHPVPRTIAVSNTTSIMVESIVRHFVCCWFVLLILARSWCLREKSSKYLSFYKLLYLYIGFPFCCHLFSRVSRFQCVTFTLHILHGITYLLMLTILDHVVRFSNRIVSPYWLPSSQQTEHLCCFYLLQKIRCLLYK